MVHAVVSTCFILITPRPCNRLTFFDAKGNVEYQTHQGQLLLASKPERRIVETKTGDGKTSSFDSLDRSWPSICSRQRSAQRRHNRQENDDAESERYAEAADRGESRRPLLPV